MRGIGARTEFVRESWAEYGENATQRQRVVGKKTTLFARFPTKFSDSPQQVAPKQQFARLGSRNRDVIFASHLVVSRHLMIPSAAVT